MNWPPTYQRIALRCSALLLGLCAATTLAQTPAILENQEIHGRPGWVLDNGKLRVALLRNGGHIGDIRLLSDNPRLSFSPMYVPAGGGYMGHMVCFPHYGPASAEERRHGLRGHGEAGSVEWTATRPVETNDQAITFFYGADLPKTQFRIERAVALKAGETAVHVEEWIENLAPYDRPYNRNQHATFGAPLVAPGKNFLDLSGTKGMTDPRRTARDQWIAGREFEWPHAPAPDGATIDLRGFHAVPNGQAYTPVLSDLSRPLSWFTLYNSDYPLLIGYVFPTADHPWIDDWQNRPRVESDAGIARGIEFGTSPFDEGLRKSVERAQLFGAPTYQWIAAGQRLSTTFTIFLTEIPADFAGVHDLEPDAEGILIIERTTRRNLRVPASPALFP